MCRAVRGEKVQAEDKSVKVRESRRERRCGKEQENNVRERRWERNRTRE